MTKYNIATITGIVVFFMTIALLAMGGLDAQNAHPKPNSGAINAYDSTEALIQAADAQARQQEAAMLKAYEQGGFDITRGDAEAYP